MYRGGSCLPKEDVLGGGVGFICVYVPTYIPLCKGAALHRQHECVCGTSSKIASPRADQCK